MEAHIVARALNTFLQNPQTDKRPADQVQNAASYSSTPQSRAEARKVDARNRQEQKKARRKALEQGDPLELEAQTRRLLLRLTL